MKREQVLNFKEKIQGLEVSPELEIIKGRVLLELDRLGDLQDDMNSIPEDLEVYDLVHEEFTARYREMLGKVQRNFDGELTARMKQLKYSSVTIKSKDAGTYILSIHCHQNITHIGNFRNKEVVLNFKEYNFIHDSDLLILLPVYNSERSLENTVDSIFSQTFKNVRISIINDASTDETVDVIEKLLLKYAGGYEGIPIALSGGIDSSLLAALIKPKFAISVQLPGGEKYNEIEYSKRVCQHLGIQHIIVECDDTKWDEYMKIACKAIGRPIPHFNMFPLFCMYKKLTEMGEKKVVLGDGPDEVMMGYARDLILSYIYKVYDFEAFRNYKPLIDKVLPPINKAISAVTGKETDETNINRADIDLMRPDMDDMSNGIARHFGIQNLRPYQDNLEIDNFMYLLPNSKKIYEVEYGKYALRKVAEKYLPKEIAWRKKKVGGPVFPVNILRGWDKEDGEFGKKHYMKYQEDILNNRL